MYYKIKPELAQKILAYLSSKPFKEVYGMIQEMQGVELVKEEEKVEEQESKK